MPIATGYPQLQPRYILGTDNWTSEAAEQMVGADIDRANQLRDHFPFHPVARARTLVVPRVATLGAADFVGMSSVTLDANTTSLTEPGEEFDLTSLVGTVDLTSYAADTQSWSIDQLELHIEFVKIGIRVAFWNQFFRPALTNGYRGLPDLVGLGQTVTSEDRLTLDDMDELVSLVTEADAEMDRKVILMHSRTFVNYVRAVRATGASLEYAMRGGRRYAVHRGVPILLSDYIPLTPVDRATATTEVWCCTLGIADKGLYGIVPPEIGDSGLVVERVQGELAADTQVYRVRWYTTVVLGHRRGLARLTDVTVDSAPLG